MNTADFSYEKLLEMREETSAAIKARYGDQPLFGILENIEKLLDEKRSTKTTGKNGAHIPQVRHLNGKASSDEVARLAAEYLKGNNNGFDAATLVENLRLVVPLPKADRAANATVSAVLTRRPEQFKKLGKNARGNAVWKLRNAVSDD